MSFAVHHPASVGEAVALAATLPASRYIAGGTDLVIQMNRRRVAPDNLIDLTGIAELARIDEQRQSIVIGALATHKAIERHPAFQHELVALVEAARVVGGHQVRNIGTVGGNVVNASPAADVVAPLLALDAELTLAGKAGSRTLRLADFLRGPGETDRSAEEVLTQLRIAKLPPGSATTFLKAGRRKAMEISVVCVAAQLTLGSDGTCRAAALALGAVGPTTLRARRAEAFLEGRPATEEGFRVAGRLAAEAASPISDVRASSEYRRRLVATLVERALATCLSRIREQS